MGAVCEMVQIYVKIIIRGLACVQLHLKQWCLKEGYKSVRFDMTCFVLINNHAQAEPRLSAS